MTAHAGRTSARRRCRRGRPATVPAGLALLIIAGLAGLVLVTGAGPAAAIAPVPQETGSPAQPTSTAEPTGPTDQPTTPQPTRTQASQPSQPSTAPATTATPIPTTASAAPSTRSPTATPSPHPTTTPTVAAAERPATPAASTGSDVPPWSILIALAILAAAIPFMIRLSRRADDRFEPETTIRPDTEGAALVLMTEAGQAMIDSGYDVESVQAAMHDIAFANGLRHAEAIALPTAIFVSARIRGAVTTAAVSTGRQQLRLHQIEEIDDLVTGARQGRSTPNDAVDKIARIRAEPPPYPPLVQLIGQVLTSAALAVLLGGSPLGIAVSALLGGFVGAFGLAGAGLPGRYQVLVIPTAAFVVGLSVFLLSRSGLDFGVLPCLIAPLALLLPGAQLTTSMIELATNQMIAGGGRLAAGAMQLLLLALGIVAAAALVGIPALHLTQTTSPLGAIGPWLAVAVFGVGVVLNRCARPRSLAWILLVLYVAYGAQVLGSMVVGGVLSAFVGAAAMTPVAAVVARQRTGPPAMVSFTPGFWLLVPGALGLVGVATILAGDSSGLQTLMTTTSTMVAIALGVLVGWAITGVFRRLRRIRLQRTADDEPGPT